MERCIHSAGWTDAAGERERRREKVRSALSAISPNYS